MARLNFVLLDIKTLLLKYFLKMRKKFYVKGIKNSAWNHNWKADNKPDIYFHPIILVIFS